MGRDFWYVSVVLRTCMSLDPELSNFLIFFWGKFAVFHVTKMILPTDVSFDQKM